RAPQGGRVGRNGNLLLVNAFLGHNQEITSVKTRDARHHGTHAGMLGIVLESPVPNVPDAAGFPRFELESNFFGGLFWSIRFSQVKHVKSQPCDNSATRHGAKSRSLGCSAAGPRC